MSDEQAVDNAVAELQDEYAAAQEALDPDDPESVQKYHDARTAFATARQTARAGRNASIVADERTM